MALPVLSKRPEVDGGPASGQGFGGTPCHCCVQQMLPWLGSRLSMTRSIQAVSPRLLRSYSCKHSNAKLGVVYVLMLNEIQQCQPCGPESLRHELAKNLG